VCFVLFSEQRVILFLHSFKGLVFITEVEVRSVWHRLNL
jgi:hypothetical protein